MPPHVWPVAPPPLPPLPVEPPWPPEPVLVVCAVELDDVLAGAPPLPPEVAATLVLGEPLQAATAEVTDTATRTASWAGFTMVTTPGYARGPALSRSGVSVSAHDSSQNERI